MKIDLRLGLLEQLIAKKNAQFLRFLVVGLINTVFGYCCFALFLFMGAHYVIAATLANIIGVLFNFVSTGSFVFGVNRPERLPFYIGVYVFLYVVNLGFLKLMVIFNINMYIGAACTLLPLALLSFILNKRLVFHNDKTD